MPRGTREISTSTSASNEGEPRSSSPQRPEGRKSFLQTRLEDKERETKMMLEDIKKAKERTDLPKFESVKTALERTKAVIAERNARAENGDDIRQMQYMIKLTEDLSDHAKRKNILEVARIWDKMKDEKNDNAYIEFIIKKINEEAELAQQEDTEAPMSSSSAPHGTEKLDRIGELQRYTPSSRMLDKELTRRDRQNVEPGKYLHFAIPGNENEAEIEKVKALIIEEEKPNRLREQAMMRMGIIKAQRDDTSFLGVSSDAPPPRLEAAPDVESRMNATLNKIKQTIDSGNFEENKDYITQHITDLQKISKDVFGQFVGLVEAKYNEDASWAPLMELTQATEMADIKPQQ